MSAEAWEREFWGAMEIVLLMQDESLESWLGCFSFTSYADKRRLVEKGLLVDDERQWKLTPEGRVAARTKAVAPLLAGAFCREHAALRGNALVAKVYRQHPYYATRSEIVDKIYARTLPTKVRCSF